MDVVQWKECEIISFLSILLRMVIPIIISLVFGKTIFVLTILFLLWLALIAFLHPWEEIGTRGVGVFSSQWEISLDKMGMQFD